MSSDAFLLGRILYSCGDPPCKGKKKDAINQRRLGQNGKKGPTCINATWPVRVFFLVFTRLIENVLDVRIKESSDILDVI
jgi:hypothetical protein